MSILLKDQIAKEYEESRIVINPFNMDQIGPNSYDVRLSDKLKVYDFSETRVLDCKKSNPTITIDIPEEGYLLEPNLLYLGSTVEKIGSDNYVPMYEGRSSMARLGIQSHLSAGFGDVGFCSNWTLEIAVIHPTIIYPNMRIGQVYFHKIDSPSNILGNRYDGKYKTQEDPQESLSFKDFK
jgi:dCTP deaminase